MRAGLGQTALRKFVLNSCSTWSTVWKHYQCNNLANIWLHCCAGSWFRPKAGLFVVMLFYWNNSIYCSFKNETCKFYKLTKSLHKLTVWISGQTTILLYPFVFCFFIHLFLIHNIALLRHLHSISRKLSVATACIRDSKVQQHLNACSTSVFKHVSAVRDSFNL